MAKVTVVYDRIGNTLDVWFGRPRKVICEEVGHDVILKKDRHGRVLGFEKINFLPRGVKIISRHDLRLEAKVA
jgi:hypothetical protein